jgi:Antitoxin-like ribbon-helix-helix
MSREEVKALFRLLAAERNTSIENLHAEALNDLFSKYGKPEICPIKERGAAAGSSRNEAPFAE